MWNWTYFTENFMSLGFQPYITVLGFVFWPIIFTTIIGYTYLKQQSATSAAVIGLIIFAIFGNYLVGVDIWITAMYLLISLAITGLILVFISKNRRN